MTYDYRRIREGILGMKREGDKIVAYLPGPASIKERALLLALVEFAPTIAPSTAALAIMLGTSEREIRRLLRSAEAKGLISVRQRPGQRSIYTLTDPGQYVPPADMSPRSQCPGTPADMSSPPRTICPPKQASKAGKEAGNRSASLRSTGPEPSQSSQTKSPAKRTSKKVKATDPEQAAKHRQVVDCYFTAFEGARGAKPTFDGAEGTAVKRLLAKCQGDAERACGAIRNAFGDDFWKTKATIRTIANDPSKFMGRISGGRPNGRRGGPVQKNHDGDLFRMEDWIE